MTKAIHEIIYQNHLPVVTDTRKLDGDPCYFWCLRGPRFNANDYAKEALRQGAKMVITNRKDLEGKEGFYYIEDPDHALAEAAENYRVKFKIPVLGISGSNGKTTTKELTASVLSKKFKVYATPGNLNNHIGVPLTILNMPPNTEFAIIELGANHLGEIFPLCRISKPNLALITNVGKDHLEGFGSPEGAARANSELFEFIKINGGIIYFNTNQTLLKKYLPVKTKIITFPQKNDDYNFEPITGGLTCKIATPWGENSESNLAGDFNFDNIAAALTIGLHKEVPPTAAIEAIETYAPKLNRSQIIKTENNTIIQDAYNANPTSMEMALSYFKNINLIRKTAILGHMLELGKHTEDEHQNIINWCKEHPFANFIFCGRHFFDLKETFTEAKFYEKREQLEDDLILNKPQNQTILLKGSRGVGLEKLVRFL